MAPLGQRNLMMKISGNNNFQDVLKNNLGFTLIELLLVIAIIIILTGIAVPVSANYINERQIYNIATQFQQDILLMQNKAITYSSAGPSAPVDDRFAMRFYLSSNTCAYQSSLNASSLPSSNPVPGNGIVVRKMPSSIGFPAYFGRTTPESMKIGNNNVTSGYVDLVFDYQGKPFWSINGGSFQQTEGTINIVNSGVSKHIKVNVSVIGRVKIDWVTK